MNKSEIGLNAGKVWQLLSDYTRWSYGSLKRKSGLKDKELGAALGWLAREDKIEIHQEEDELYVSGKLITKKSLSEIRKRLFHIHSKKAGITSFRPCLPFRERPSAFLAYLPSFLQLHIQ